MRVIAGTYRSRPLLSPRGNSTRPTSDRLRETLFNILQPHILNARFADLYAGTGAVGIEALSRGAAHVLFAERAEPALLTLRANLRSLGITSGFTLEPRSAISALDRLINRAASEPSQPQQPPPPAAQRLDIVFLDPPYEAADEYANTLALLGSNRAIPILAPTALVIAEHLSKSPLGEKFGALEKFRSLKQSDAALSLFRLPPQ